MISGNMRDIMGFSWACASTNTPVILQEAGGGGMLGKAMGLHMAAVMPTHSAHMICLEDQCEAAAPCNSLRVLSDRHTIWQTTSRCTQRTAFRW